MTDQNGTDKGQFTIIQISSDVFRKTDSKLLKTGTYTLATVVLSVMSFHMSDTGICKYIK